MTTVEIPIEYVILRQICSENCPWIENGYCWLLEKRLTSKLKRPEKCQRMERMAGLLKHTGNIFLYRGDK